MIKLSDSWLLNSFTLPVSFYENKGDVARCANYVVINLYVPDFHKPKPICANAIHAVTILEEKHRENRDDLHLIFIDLEKAFD